MGTSGLWGGVEGGLLPLSGSFWPGPALYAVQEEGGGGAIVLESVSVCGGVSFGEGRVKGLLPDGPLTLWCPAAPSHRYAVAGQDCPGFPPAPPYPWSPGRLGERNFSNSLPWQRGKMGFDFKTRVSSVETEALVFGLGILQARTWGDRRKRGQRRGWGRKASPASQPPGGGAGGAARLASGQAPATSGGVASLWLDTRGQET